MNYREPILKQFVISGINSEYNEEKEQYLIKFPLIEFQRCTNHLITVTVNKNEINKEIEGNLSKIFFENKIPKRINKYHYFIDPQTTLIRDEFNYNKMIPINKKEFLFNGYQLKSNINKFSDILIIPDIEKHNLRVKQQLLNNKC